MISVDYITIPGFLTILGGAACLVIKDRAQLSLIFALSILSICFLFGIVPSTGEWPVKLYQYSAVARVTCMGMVFCMMLIGAEAKASIDRAILLVAIGLGEFVLLSGDSHTKILCTEIIIFMSWLLLFTGTNLCKRDLSYFLAAKAATVVLLSACLTLAKSHVVWLEPAFSIRAQKISLRDMIAFCTILGVAIQFFAPPLTSLLSRIYAAKWSTHTMRSMASVFPMILFICFITTFKLDVPILKFVGCVQILYVALVSLCTLNRHQIMAYNAVSHAGISLIALGYGGAELALAYLTCYMLCHTGFLYCLEKSPLGLSSKLPWTVIMIIGVILPLGLCPPYPISSYFLSIFSMAVSDKIVLAALALHVASNWSHIIYRLTAHTDTKDGSVITRRTMMVYASPVLASAVLGMFFNQIIGRIHSGAAVDIMHIDYNALAAVVPWLSLLVAIYLILNRLIRTKLIPRHNLDLRMGAIPRYLFIMSSRFFSWISSLAFDYGARLVYNCARMDSGATPGHARSSGASVEINHDGGVCIFDAISTCRFLVITVSTLLGLGAWACFMWGATLGLV